MKLMEDNVKTLILQSLASQGLTMEGLSVAIGKNKAYVQQWMERGIPKFLNEIDRKKVSALLNIQEKILMPPELKNGDIGAALKPPSNTGEVNELITKYSGDFARIILEKEKPAAAIYDECRKLLQALIADAMRRGDDLDAERYDRILQSIKRGNQKE